jgi:hypothetical protein
MYFFISNRRTCGFEVDLRVYVYIGITLSDYKITYRSEKINLGYCLKMGKDPCIKHRNTPVEDKNR